MHLCVFSGPFSLRLTYKRSTLPHFREKIKQLSIVGLISPLKAVENAVPARLIKNLDSKM